MKDWSKPKEMNDVELAFPSAVIGKYLPDSAEIPNEFWSDDHPMNEVASRLFYGNIPGSTTFETKPGINAVWAYRQIKACLGSYEPRHDHKMAGVAYLLDQFFASVTIPPSQGEWVEGGKT